MASLCVEDRNDARGKRVLIRGDVDQVGGDYVECIDCDNFCAGCESDRLCCGDGDSQAGERTRADGDVNVLYLPGLSAETVEQAADRGEKLGAVAHRRGESDLIEQVIAEGEGD